MCMNQVCFVPTDLLRKVGEEELPDAMREEETDEGTTLSIPLESLEFDKRRLYQTS